MRVSRSEGVLYVSLASAVGARSVWQGTTRSKAFHKETPRHREALCLSFILGVSVSLCESCRSSKPRPTPLQRILEQTRCGIDTELAAQAQAMGLHGALADVE